MWLNQQSHIAHSDLANYFPNHTTTSFKYCFAELCIKIFNVIISVVDFFCLLLDSYFT